MLIRYMFNQIYTLSDVSKVQEAFSFDVYLSTFIANLDNI